MPSWPSISPGCGAVMTAMPGRPSGTSAARSADGPAAPVTRSGRADDHPMPQRTPGPFRKLDAMAVPTGRRHPVPFLWGYMCGDHTGRRQR
jgi:hypothetical protein